MRRRTALALQERYEVLRPSVEEAHPLLPYSEVQGRGEDAFIAAQGAIGEKRAEAYRKAMPDLAEALARDKLMTRVFLIAFGVLAGATGLLILVPLIITSLLAVALAIAAIAVLLYVVLVERVMQFTWQRRAVSNFHLEYEVTTSMLRELHVPTSDPEQ